VAISAYGEKFGVAFQLSDDLLDIASESEDSGKTPGTDLREGVRTLPVLLALRRTDPTEARLRELLSGPLLDDARHAEALGLLRGSPAMAEARDELVRWAESARSELASLPPGPATDALSQMCDVVVDRST
jgi:heptaprenyl diphosphate synthase